MSRKERAFRSRMLGGGLLISSHGCRSAAARRPCRLRCGNGAASSRRRAPRWGESLPPTRRNETSHINCTCWGRPKVDGQDIGVSGATASVLRNTLGRLRGVRELDGDLSSVDDRRRVAEESRFNDRRARTFLAPVDPHSVLGLPTSHRQQAPQRTGENGSRQASPNTCYPRLMLWRIRWISSDRMLFCSVTISTCPAMPSFTLPR